MNTEALRQLTRILQRVQQDSALFKSFHLDFWFDNTRSNRNDFKELFARPIEPEKRIYIPAACGTTACACGYAGLDPWFTSRGFHLVWDERMRNGNGAANIVYHTNGQTLTGWHAIKAMFGLDSITIQELFTEGFYPLPVEPRHVIDRIQLVLDGKWSSDWAT